MRMRYVIVSLAVLAAGTMPGIAAETGGAARPMPVADTAGFRFELAAAPKPAVNGKNLVIIRLLRGGKPVTGAIIIDSRADMGPMGMAAMTAPVKPLGERPPGIYRFEIAAGPMRHKPDLWAISFAAKVQGVAQTVNGKVVVNLSP